MIRYVILRSACVLALFGASGGVAMADPSPSANQVAQASESANSNSPPSLYRSGISLRNEGKLDEAAAYFLAAAQRGYHLAEVELAYLHADEDSSMRDDPAAFAWFALARMHEKNPKLATVLKLNQQRVRARMNVADRAEGLRLSKILINNLGAVPAYNEVK